MPDYRLPDGSTPILLSSDTAEALRREAAALAAYLAERPGVTPDAVADMLFRTRAPRRYRALAAVTHREQLLEALHSIAAGRPYPAVVAGDRAASARRIAYVFPGQGSQRPGMGVLYYRHSPVFRATVDECDAIFQAQHGISPLSYLLDETGAVTENVEIVQPALFMQMLGLAASWRAAGVEPHLTVGHSQGEIAAAVVSGIISLADGIRVVTLRAALVGSLERENDWNGRWAMAVVGIERDECEALLARNSGWAELAVVNSAHVLAVSGERPAVATLVENLTAQGKFAKEIRVEYPAHTSFVSKFREQLEGTLHDTLDSPVFAPTEIACVGATLGEVIAPDLPPAEYWYWNLRNRVRFDLAVAEAAARGADIFLEIADHPALMVAMQDTLSGFGPDRDFRTIGTSRRTATGLGEFTKNLAQVAVLDATFPWDSLRHNTTDVTRLPLLDFPNTQTTPKQLWAPFDYGSETRRAVMDSTRPAGAPSAGIRQNRLEDSQGGSRPKACREDAEADLPLAVHPAVAPGTVVPQRLAERWVRLDRRTLVPPRTLAIIDHTGRRADLAAAIEQAAARHGATVVGAVPAAGTVSAEGGTPLGAPDARSGSTVTTGFASGVTPAVAPGTAGAAAAAASARASYDTVVILLPSSAGADIATAVTESAEFVGDRGWLPDLTGVRDIWLVTFGGEQVLDGETPDIAHAAAQAGFRCLAAEYPGVGFRHVDIGAGQELPDAAKAVLGAAHTAGEPELAARAGAWYAKRLVLDETPGDCPLTPSDLDEVMIIGGTGALGLDCAADFARAGARRITLISRSGGAAEAKERVRELNSLGAIVEIRTCDVTDDDAVRALGDEFVLTPVSLLVHAAVDYAAAAAEPSPETVRAAAESKVVALDRLIRELPLAPDARVVLCSSLSATIGGRGHAVYAAVNRMLDAAATGYRRDGIGVTSVQWGLWRAVGADNADALARISGTGLLPMDPATSIAAGFAASGNCLVVAAEWFTLREIFALFGQDPLFADLPDRPVAQPNAGAAVTGAVSTSTGGVEVGSMEANAVDSAGGGATASAVAAVPALTTQDIAGQVQDALRVVMGMDTTEPIDGSMPLVALGLDSLQALDLRKLIETQLQRDLPVTAILGGASLDEVVSLLG